MKTERTVRCALCGADTRQANAITCARTLTGNDCDERLHAEMERLAPGRVWTDADYLVALDVLLAVTPPTRPPPAR